MQFGRSYEEFEVGAVYKHWPGKTVTEYDDHLFCLLTMNHHPLHLDAHYAEGSTQFGQQRRRRQLRLLAAARHVGRRTSRGKAIANLEIESLRHVAPTFHGDTIYGETTVLDKWESTSKDDRGVVHVETVGYNQDGTMVCIFRRKVMVPKENYLEARGGEQPGGRPSPTRTGREADAGPRPDRRSAPEPSLGAVAGASRASTSTPTPTPATAPSRRPSVVASAADAGLDVVALTDHDTTSAAGQEAVDAAVRHGVGAGARASRSPAPGTAISVHLLGYLHDPADTALHGGAGAQPSQPADPGRADRGQAVGRTCRSPTRRCSTPVAPGATLGRPHIADALVAKGLAPSRDAAFADYLYTGSPYYASHYAPDPVTAVRLVTGAGGVAVMAHPFAGRRGRLVDDEVIEEMAAAGLAGLEAHHRDHEPADVARAEAMARRLGLFVTGSSDYHGAGKGNLLGENTTSPYVLEQIEERASGVAGRSAVSGLPVRTAPTVRRRAAAGRPPVAATLRGRGAASDAPSVPADSLLS